ncbi:MAG: amino acid ABC transporter, partial [Bradyrhizobium sp.]|nr:amino acid ABC transporter [Bradyrhizobium sp.]MDU6835052.1 amino acid ABC transporter [Bradyrhizobium sp.]
MGFFDRTIATLTGIALLWGVASAALAEQASRLDEIMQRGSLRVGMTGDYKPFTYLDKAT